MDKNLSFSILYKHNESKKNSNVELLRNENNEIIIVLGFLGSSVRNLKNKYAFLGEELNKDVLAIVFPSRLMFFEKGMWKWVKENMDRFKSQGYKNRNITLVVSSGGGTVLFIHFLKWIREQLADSLKIKRIMWEHAPGSITAGEYHRAIINILNSNNPIVKFLLYPLIYLSCKILDLFSDYASRIRNAPWDAELIPETVCNECCIINRYDPILKSSYVSTWVKEMKKLGRKINLNIFDVNGHLNGHRAYRNEYLKVWKKFIIE